MDINVEDIDENWEEIEEILSPLHLEKPYLKFFFPDLGMHLLKVGSNLDTPYYFIPTMVQSIQKVSDNLYTLFSVSYFGREFAVSFDFSNEQFDEFINAVPVELREMIIFRLRTAPFNVMFQSEEELFPIVIEARRTEKIYNNGNEEYIPLKVVKFSNIT